VQAVCEEGFELRAALFTVMLLAGYGALFIQQEAQTHHEHIELTPTFPARLQQSLGYLRQLGAEMLYIKAAVFLGGREMGTPPLQYADRLANHFDIMVALHPKFLDTYYLTEAHLPWISETYARRANAILLQGLSAHPETWELPFFAGFNHFRYLDDRLEAADLLWRAAQKEKGPVWLSHLASMLAAEGGDILAGLAWLRAMRAAEEDEAVRDRYLRDITEFEKAAHVLKAIAAYKAKHGFAPQSLEALQPEFLDRLPAMAGDYELQYEAPRLHLKRKRAG
jgi:hypothetical protein